jgi:Flp pilus assembly protein TadG
VRLGARVRGQSTLELALVLPFVALLLMLVIQVGLVVRAQVMAIHAAREAARIVAITNDPALAADAAARSAGLDPESIDVIVAGSAEPGTDVTVSVEHNLVTDVPLIGPLLGDVTLRAAATMRAEG